jgi:hypothetical protein
MNVLNKEIADLSAQAFAGGEPRATLSNSIANIS